MNVLISVDLAATGLRDLAQMLGPSALAQLHGAMGEGLREVTREHLQAESLSRHTTAQRLGATPSGHLGQAARAVEAAPLTSDSAGAWLTINHPGLGRALHAVTIVPVRAKALAIPVAALAYNRRPGQFGRDELFVWKSKTTGNAFLALRQEDKHASLLLMYLLVRSVTQPQDRSLLPSEGEWEAAALEAGTAWFDQEISSVS